MRSLSGRLPRWNDFERRLGQRLGAQRGQPDGAGSRPGVLGHPRSAAMVPSGPTETSGGGVPPRRSLNGHPASLRSTVAVMPSVIPPGPLLGFTLMLEMLPGEGRQAWASVTVTVTVAALQSAVGRVEDVVAEVVLEPVLADEPLLGCVDDGLVRLGLGCAVRRRARDQHKGRVAGIGIRVAVVVGDRDRDWRVLNGFGGVVGRYRRNVEHAEVALCSLELPVAVHGELQLVGVWERALWDRDPGHEVALLVSRYLH